jgi:hypothetical protein
MRIALLLAVLAQDVLPVEIEGKQVHGIALVDGRVDMVVEYADGRWRHDGTAVSANQLLSDPRAAPVDFGNWQARPVKKSYRSSEGWQALRWGMTLKEAKAALPTWVFRKDDGAPFEWVATSEKGAVHLHFSNGGLAFLGVRPVSLSRAQVLQLLEKKWGAPNDAERGWWLTAESEILVPNELLPSILLKSRAFAPFVVREVEQAEQTAAHREL